MTATAAFWFVEFTNRGYNANMLLEMWNIMLALSPWLLLGAAVAGLLHVLVPANWLARQLSGSMSVAKSVLLGVPLPLCSCGVIPVAMALRKSGATRGATVGFLVSTPQTGVDSIMVSAGMLGWPFTVFKVLSAAATGLIAGWFVDRAVPNDRLLPQASSTPSERRSVLALEFLRHAEMLLRSVWLWLVIGIVVSAAITTLIPAESMQTLAGFGPVVAMLVVLFISLPMYVCATASVPIAAALVAGGMPVGAALVFLMAGPASNVATVGAVYKVLGSRALLIYIATIVIGSIAGGLLFNWLIDASIVHSHDTVHQTHWWSVLSAWTVSLLFVYYACLELFAFLRRHSATVTDAPAITLPVEGMTCQGCVRKLSGVLSSSVNVSAVDVQLSPGSATVWGKIDEASLRQLVAKAGFHSPHGEADAGRD